MRKVSPRAYSTAWSCSIQYFFNQFMNGMSLPFWRRNKVRSMNSFSATVIAHDQGKTVLQAGWFLFKRRLNRMLGASPPDCACTRKLLDNLQGVFDK